MTDFDYEILDAISSYAEPVERVSLQRKHFAQYDITYNLRELSRVETQRVNLSAKLQITVSLENSACLRCHEKRFDSKMPGVFYTYEFYSLTDKGRALLTNWQRRRDEQKIAQCRREQNNFILSFGVGVTTGIIATIICKLLGL